MTLVGWVNQRANYSFSNSNVINSDEGEDTDEEKKILFQVGGLHRQPPWSMQEQLYLLMVLCWLLYWLSRTFPSTVLTSSAIPFTLSRRQCWIKIEKLCIAVRQRWAVFFLALSPQAGVQAFQSLSSIICKMGIIIISHCTGVNSGWTEILQLRLVAQYIFILHIQVLNQQ